MTERPGPEVGRDCAIGIFARIPVPGRTKTRLIPRLGPEGAARFHLASLLDTCDTVASTGSPWIVFATPLSGAAVLRRLGVRGEIRGQGPGTLGRRMERAFDVLFGSPYVDRAILVGSDSPDLPAALLRTAISALDTEPSVLAPAGDGGFVLVGIQAGRRRELAPGRLFGAIPWSQGDTLERTVAHLTNLGLPPARVPGWWDVDEPEDLVALRTRLNADPNPAVAARTRALLRDGLDSP